MSVRVSSWAWRLSSSGGTDRLVLLALADEADDDGLLHHRRSQAHVARKCNVSPDTVRRAVRRLVDLGELEVLGAGDGRRQTDYRIIMRAPNEGLQPATPAPAPVPPQGSRAATPGVAPVPPPSSRSDHDSLPVVSPAPARRRDELWESVLMACGIEAARPLTARERGAYNRAVKELRDAGATAELVPVRAAHYRQHFGDAALTPPALARHWTLCENPPRRAPRLSSTMQGVVARGDPVELAAYERAFGGRGGSDGAR